jgi:hypothetical protein
MKAWTTGNYTKVATQTISDTVLFVLSIVWLIWSVDDSFYYVEKSDSEIEGKEYPISDRCYALVYVLFMYGFLLVFEQV